MGREFTPTIEAARTSRALRKYFAAVSITLPLSAGDVTPVVIRVAEGAVEMKTGPTFSSFTYDAFIAILARNPLEVEEDDWVADLTAALATSAAAMLTEARAKVRSLFVSAEYTARNRTDDGFVSDLYKGYLGRPPEVGGKAFWLAELLATSRAHLLDAFEVSIEFDRKVATVETLQSFAPDVRAVSPLVMSDGQAADNIDLSLVNLDDTYSLYLGEEDRILYPAPAVVYRAYPVAGGGHEADAIYPGFAKFKVINGRVAELTVTSDATRKGLTVGNVETQRCPLIYKGPGCDTNDPSPTCSRIWDDAVNGCASKDPAPVLIGATTNHPSFGGGPDRAVEATGVSEEAPANPVPDGFNYPGYTDPDDPRMRNFRRSYSTL